MCIHIYIYIYILWTQIMLVSQIESMPESEYLMIRKKRVPRGRTTHNKVFRCGVLSMFVRIGAISSCFPNTRTPPSRPHPIHPNTQSIPTPASHNPSTLTLSSPSSQLNRNPPVSLSLYPSPSSSSSTRPTTAKPSQPPTFYLPWRVV